MLRMFRSALSASVVLLSLAPGCGPRPAPVDAGPPDGSVTCGAGQAQCGSMCVSLDLDNRNCGSCGLACGGGERCEEGECILSCPAGQEPCTTGGARRCVSISSDPANCGGCGLSCASGEACSDGACAVTCSPSEARCAVGDMFQCADLDSDPVHCGECGQACSAGERCEAGECELDCPAGQEVCAGTCVFTDRDPFHCGTCENVCPSPAGGSATCTNRTCMSACPAGQTDCDDVCRDLSIDSTTCGSCDRTCEVGEICAAAECVPDLPALGGETFRLETLTGDNCDTVATTDAMGDDRGGIGVTTSRVLVTGDTASARVSRTTLGAPTRIPAYREALVSNVRNGQIYSLADDDGPLPRGGGTITRLIRLSTGTGQPLTSGHVELSSPIVAMGDESATQVGIFSGYDRVVIHNGTRAYSIALADGAVTNLGLMGLPTHSRCETWAFWGIAETAGLATNLIYVRDSTSIVRVRVPTGDTLGVFAFSNLADTCAISVYAPRDRWYFKHEGPSQFAGSSSEYMGYCDATFSTATGFTVSSLTGSGCRTYSHTLLTGDDRGGLAVSSIYMFYNGDTSAARVSSTLPPATTARVGQIYDTLVSDLETRAVYALAASERTPIRAGGDIATHLIQLNSSSGAPTTTTVALSMPIDLTAPTFGSNVGFFSGYGRAVVLANGRAYHIALPSGEVTDLGMMNTPGRLACEGWGYWGVAEFFGSQLFVTYVAANGEAIERARVPDGQTETVTSLGDLGDMCTFTVATDSERWYWVTEQASAFNSTTGEHLGACDMTWSSP